MHSSAQRDKLQPVMAIYQDEAIYRSKETNHKSWMIEGGVSVCLPTSSFNYKKSMSLRELS